MATSDMTAEAFVAMQSDEWKQQALAALLRERGYGREYGVRERVGNRMARYRDLNAAMEEARRTGARMPIPIYVPARQEAANGE